MNLVQINERLKDLPMQVLQQYANGMNPEVPPYLALGELQRRELSQKQMATAKGAAQGPQPSVKEQVEQKAGLMALQQMQQQQAAQQMQQPRGPMPAPEGVPQPEPQPEAAMMARGGLASVPVRRDMFEFARGGIIAFSNGGQSLNERAARQMQEKGSIYDPYFGVPEEERRRLKAEDDLKKAQSFASGSLSLIQSNAQAMSEGAQARVNELEQNREELTRKYGTRMYEQALNKAKQEVEAATARGAELVNRQTQTGQERVAAATPPPPPPAPISRPTTQMTPQQMEAKMSSGLPGALQKAGSAAAAAPTAAPGAAPTAAPKALPEVLAAVKANQGPAAAPTAQAAPTAATQKAPEGQTSLMSEALAAVRKEPTAPTPEGIIQEQNKLLPSAMQEANMKKMLDDQRARAKAREEAYQSSRPSGLDDLIRVFGQAGQYKGLSGLAPAYTANKDRRRAEDLAFQKQQDELLTAIEGRDYAAAEKLFTARQGSLTEAQKAYQTRLTSNTKALADLAGVDQRRMDEAAQRLTSVQIAKLQAASANRPSEAERINAEYLALVAKNKPAEAEAYLERMSRIKGGTSSERNDIKAIETLLKNQQEIISNPLTPKADKEAARLRVDEYTKQLERLGGSAGAKPQQTGKAPPPPPGFKLN